MKDRKEINIVITGDFCPVGKISDLNFKVPETVFHNFYPILRSSDLNVTNLECPLIDYNNQCTKFGPVLRANKSSIELLKYANFNLVTLANNHIMDHGIEGLKSTIETCQEAGISYVGAGNNLSEARKPFMINIKGKNICILNFAENEFSNTHGNYAGSNPLSLTKNFSDIVKAKNGADYVIVIIHGGNEMYRLPSPRFKDTLRFFIEAGANAVLAHHTHCFSGYEIYKDSPIFYGVGNFLFDYNMRNNQLWYTGIAVNLVLKGNNISFKIIPFNQNRGDEDGIYLLNKDEQSDFQNIIKNLNAIIQDEEKLEKEFLKFVELKRKQYSHFLEPYTNRLLHGLYGKKVIPSFLNKKKRMLYLNLIRCESHRDVILEILKNEISYS